MQTLYQQAILTHNREPHHYGEMDNPSLRVRVLNPVCGDEVTLMLAVVGEIIEDVRFTAQGCALCRASASMMSDLISELTITAADRLAEEVRLLFQGKAGIERLATFGELAALAGVRDHPARIKCVLLPWQALEDALEQWDDKVMG
ncbi:MAG: SUF system NifU family Fe-S cluster assembly protein [Calditrichae bacterium]|nr:SUF system NifU family Fe-S cluster assembly protein [Calditrichia bacterium]